jgi:hypothetical protein
MFLVKFCLALQFLGAQLEFRLACSHDEESKQLRKQVFQTRSTTKPTDRQANLDAEERK